jgi:hypothetical protein
MGVWITRKMAINILNMVIKNERFKLGQNHHSDLGVQYASNEFHLLIKTKEIL